MKNVFKRISALTMALLLMLSLGAAAFAAPSTITFEGYEDGFEFLPGSEYTTTDLFQSFKNVMPGDVLYENITFTNTATDCDFVMLWMKAVPHDETENPLSEKVAEEETVATMTDFLSQLSMKIWNGTQLIYSASPDETDGLTDYVLLGNVRRGETLDLKVELSVPIELGNEYANRVGEVDWVFYLEGYNESQLSVRKVWSDGNSIHKDESVTVNLLKDGDVESSVELNAENGWAYTFDRLVEGHEWTVEEAEVPEGYYVNYKTEGTSVTITNTKPVPPEKKPLDIEVKKLWSNDEEKSRPESVTVTLYDGGKVYDTVKLTEENNWSYHWKDKNVKGNWQVIETSIPKGYTPSYKVTGNVTTITNTWKLIQTGQLNWPIVVLGGAGIALITLGGVMLLRKKRENA